MGYLLPIQFNQYQDYQNRIKGLKSNYRQTVKVDSVKRVYLSQIKNQGMHTKTKNRMRHEQDTSKVYAEITGIGGIFDKKI